MWRASILAVTLAMASPALAQDDQTLADIRQELTVLFVELQQLRQELNTSGFAGSTGSAGSALDRVGAIESEVQRLTAKTEELEFRIDRIVRDGTNQIGDLEFRLCELEPECDIAALGDTPTLGGDLPSSTQASAEPQVAGPELAIGEQAEFDQAQAALEAGDFDVAAQSFTSFQQTFPGSPLQVAAELGRGQAIEGLGDVKEAARIYLAAFTADQLGEQAPDALYLLGSALGKLGQRAEACVTLGEVSNRYPTAFEAQASAEAAMTDLSCS